MENLELINEINIKKIKNKLQFAIIDILYKNVDKEFTIKTLYNELNNSIFNTSLTNNKDIYIIYCFIWTLLLKKNSNFIINKNNTHIRININYYKITSTKKINDEQYKIESTEQINEPLYSDIKISTNYFIKHMIKYKEIYIKSKIIKYFIKNFKFNNEKQSDFNIYKILSPKIKLKNSNQKHTSKELYIPINIYIILLCLFGHIVYTLINIII